MAESRDTATLGGSLRWIRAGLVLSFAALVMAAFVYQGGIDFPPINDEEQFWKQVEAKNVTELAIGKGDIRGEFVSEVQLDPSQGRGAI